MNQTTRSRLRHPSPVPIAIRPHSQRHPLGNWPKRQLALRPGKGLNHGSCGFRQPVGPSRRFFRRFCRPCSNEDGLISIPRYDASPVLLWSQSHCSYSPGLHFWLRILSFILLSMAEHSTLVDLRHYQVMVHVEGQDRGRASGGPAYLHGV